MLGSWLIRQILHLAQSTIVQEAHSPHLSTMMMIMIMIMMMMIMVLALTTPINDDDDRDNDEVKVKVENTMICSPPRPLWDFESVWRPLASRLI